MLQLYNPHSSARDVLVPGLMASSLIVRFRPRNRVMGWSKPCPCRRTGFRLRIVGRTDDMLILRGVNVFPSAIKDVVS